MNVICYMKGDGNGKKVRDVMEPLERFPWVDINDDMSQLTETLYAHCKNGMNHHTTIVGNHGVAVGLVTMRNIFEALEPEAFYINQWSVPVFWDGLWNEQTRGLKSKKICDIFVPIKMIGVQADSNLMRAVYCFNRTKMPALAVMDDQNVIGVIEVLSIFNEILQAKREGV